MANVDLTSPETLARTVLESKPAVGAVRNARQLQADRIRAEAVEKGPRSALESVKAAKVPSEADVNARIAENYYAGVTRNAAGGVDKQVHAPGSAEALRQGQILDRAQTLRLILENGFENLAPGPAKAEMLKFAADTVKGWPDAKALYDSIPGNAAAKDAVFNPLVERMLGNAEMRKFLQNRFAGVMDKDRPFEKIKIELVEAQARALERRDKIKDKILSNNIELLAINGEVDSFRQGVAGKGLELRNLNNELGTLNSSKSRYENFITNQDSLKSELVRSREENRALGNTNAVKRIDAGIAQVEKELAKGQKSLKEVNDKLSKREQLLAEQQKAQERKKEIQEEQDKLDPQLDDAEDKLNRARTEAAANKSAHDKDEAELADDLRDVMVGGMQDFLGQEITRAEEARQKIIDKEAADAKDKKPPEEQNVEKALNTRWDRDVSNRNFVRKWWNPSNRELDTSQIDADYRRLVTENTPGRPQGPDLMIVRMLRDSNPGRFMNDAAAEGWMAANGEAVNRMRGQIVETLMTKRVQTGKITESDARYIAGTTWGEGIITKALEKRQEIADQIKELHDKGIIKGNVGEWVKGEIRRNPVFWLTILLGSAAIGAIGPAISIAYSTGTGVAGAMAAGLSAEGAAGMAGAAGVGLGATRYVNRN